MDIIDSTEISRKTYCEPTFTKDFSEHGQIICIEFSQFEWSQDVLLIAFENKILLGHLEFAEAFEIDIRSEIKHPCRCMALNISPETSLSALPKSVVFCSAGSDYKLRVFKSDLVDDNKCLVLSGHTSYVNDVKYDPENNYLASVSDDNTAKLWDTAEYKCVATFNLTSPGMSVCWNREDSSKLLVAEKIGIIKFYNVERQRAILSIDHGTMLFSAHWAPSDCQLVASLQLGELLIWDLTKPCQPVHSNLIFSEAGKEIKFSPLGELVAAVNSLEGVLKVVATQNQQIKFSTSVMLPSNLCWHYRFPIICIGDDAKLCFWKVTAK